MKTFSFLFTAAMAMFIMVSHSNAADIIVNADMQKCVANEDCLLVSNDCKQSCGFLPVNKATLNILQETYTAKCGKPMEDATTCTMTPPLKATCINSRCTIDAAFKETSTAKDYQAGAFGVPEAAQPNKVVGDYTKVDDKKTDFTAYNLPQDEVKQKTVGQIFDKIYVPADAPVKGDQYTTVTAKTADTAPQASPQPSVAAPVQPAPQIPPQVQAPAQPIPAQPIKVAPPAPVASPAVPSIPAPVLEQPKPLANVPEMTPTKPNQVLNDVKKTVDDVVPQAQAPQAQAPQVQAPKAPTAPSLSNVTAPVVNAPAPMAPTATNPVVIAPKADMKTPTQPMLTELPDPSEIVEDKAQEKISTEKPVEKKGFATKGDKKDAYNLN